jgi:5'-nucleotidase
MRQAIPLGNYIADAMLDRYKSAGATLAVMNGGGIRASLPSTYKVADTSLRRAGTPYDLVVGDVYSVLPFNNRCVVRSITGDVLWQMLEHAVYTMPDARGRFLQVAGIEFTWKESAAPSARVQSIKLPDGSTMTRAIRDGDPAAWATFAAKEFTIVLNDYNNSGGDGYAMLVEATPSPAGDLLTDVLLEYIKTHPVADADGTERIVRQQ